MNNQLQEWLEQKKYAALDFINPKLETCSQIAGNNAFAIDGFTTPGLGRHILSIPHHGAQSGGDIHYVTVCGHRMKSKFVLIDARGHGEAASKLSARLLGSMGRLASQPDNQSLLAEINALIYNTDDIPALATAAAGTFNDLDGTWTYAYAGLPNMLIRHNGLWSELHPDGDKSLPCGMMNDSDYYQTTTTLRLGDWVMMYSDGILSTVERHKAKHDAANLIELAASVDAETTERFFHAFVERLVEANQRADFEDDLTLILIERK